MDILNDTEMYTNPITTEGNGNRLNEEEGTKQEQHEYVGFWIRMWAYLVDLVVIFSVNGFLLSPFKFINGGMPVMVSYWSLEGIVAGIIFYLYFLLMTKFFSQTVGKMIFNIKVISVNDKKLGWGDLIFREVIGRFIYRVFFFMKLLYLFVAFTKEKEGLHDMIGNTRVVKCNDRV